MQNNTVEEGKTMAIISYLWWIGFIIAFISNNSKKNAFTSFHIRQSVGLLMLNFITGLLYKFGLGFAGFILLAATFVLWGIALISAFNGEEKEVPVVGDKFQDWFKAIS